MRSGRNRIAETVLVAGGAGFVGSHLCRRLLDDGHKVICMDNFLTGMYRNIAALSDRPRFTLVEQDVCKPFLHPERIGRIYNLACAASPSLYQADPVHTMMTNVRGTWNLLTLAEQNHATFVQASTSEIYGDPEEHPQTEDYRGHVNCTGPRACYDEGKRAAETLCFDFMRARRADARVARIFNTYGPRMREDDGRVISNLVVQALRNRPLTIYGEGHQTRSFCYVTDLVAGLVALMELPVNPGAPINIGNPAEFTICELMQKILRLTGSDSEVVFRPLPTDDPRRRRPDIARARSLLGWQPHISLNAGLTRTIRWFRDSIADEEAESLRGKTASAGTKPAAASAVLD